MARNYNSFYYTYNKEEILMYVKYNSADLFEILKTNLDSAGGLILFRKYLSHSDLVTKGKLGSDVKKKLSKEDMMKRYKLYYQNVADLLQTWQKKDPPVAGQSNICMGKEFYSKTNIKSYEENYRKPRDIIGENNLTAFIPYDTVTDFNLEDLNKICEVNKKNKYAGKEAEDLKNFNIEQFLVKGTHLLEVKSLHIAAHGLGTDEDELFSYLRSFVFKGDVLNVLYDKKENILYLFFERNEKYYSLLAEYDKAENYTPPIWRDYSEEDKKEIVETLCLAEILTGTSDKSTCTDAKLLENTDLKKLLDDYRKSYNKTVEEIIASGEIPKQRWYQKKWKEVLIKADELQFNKKGAAVCAITGISGDYIKLGKFFVASHIKPYAECIKNNEYGDAFDPDNGLILSANIDALFDRHLISIDESGKICAKKAVTPIKKRIKLKQLDKYYLTESRKKYLSEHKKEFDRLPDD